MILMIKGESMNTSKKAILIFVLLLMVIAGQLCAQRRGQGGQLIFTLASLVPEATPWGAALNRMAAEWEAATNGEIRLIIHHGGVAGDEAEVLRKLRLNEIQAAVFTSIGLRSVVPELMTVSYPFLLRDDAELDLVLSIIKPELDARAQQNGFVTLTWAKAGWIRIFSRAPVFTPADLRRQRLGCSPDDQEILQAFRAMGFQVVPVNITDTLVSLRSGMVDAVYWSPVAAAAAQIFGIANHMSTMNLAPFLGGILMNQTAWRRIPERHRPRLLEITRQIGNELDNAITRLDAEAIATMARHGLIINEPSPQQRQEWYAEINRHESRLIPIFNRELYQKIIPILETHRGR